MSPKLQGFLSGLKMSRTGWVVILVLCAQGSISGCAKEKIPNPCGRQHLFQILPVELSHIRYAAPIGILAPVGGSPLPKYHAGLMLNTLSSPVVAPVDLTVTQIRRVKYVTSPSRPGYEDYAIFFQVCDEVKGHFGHVTQVDASLVPPASQLECQTYSTVDETVESCSANTEIRVTQGTQMATSGSAAHSPAIDMGMSDSSVSDGFINPSRYGRVAEPGTLCPWDWYVESVKTSLYEKIGSQSQFTTESPKCGSVALDRDGTVAGRWTLKSAPADGRDSTAGDFVVFAPEPYAAESRIALSTRIVALAPGVSNYPKFPRELSGRVNISPSSIGVDGLIYCYVEGLSTSTISFLVRMTSTQEMKAEKVPHSAGSSVCASDPSSWAFSGSAVDLIR